MAKIVVRKKVTLEFLGEDYKDSYLTFESIPMSAYDDLIRASESLQGDGKQSFEFVKEQILSRFIEGKFNDGSSEIVLTKDNLLDLPGEVFTESFERLTSGLSPK